MQPFAFRPPGANMNRNGPKSLIEERAWIRHRIERLSKILLMINDACATTAIRELIAEAEQRLDALQSRGQGGS
jgi:hypothetical protein